jgi:protein-S-isoprenylcysteine O-methyltransferase Ste14
MKVINSVHGRVARPATLRRNITKTLLQVAVMWSVFLLIGPLLAYEVEGKLHLARYRFTSAGWRRVGAGLFVAGGTLGLTSAWFMVRQGHGTPLPADATRRLVIAGPYRHVRNPMAMGSIAQGVASGLFLGSPLAALYAVVGGLGWNYFVRPWEEQDLVWRFGRPYLHYRDNVRCWVPQLTPYEAPVGADRRG